MAFDIFTKINATKPIIIVVIAAQLRLVSNACAFIICYSFTKNNDRKIDTIILTKYLKKFNQSNVINPGVINMAINQAAAKVPKNEDNTFFCSRLR